MSMLSGFSGLNMNNTEKKNRLEASLYCYYCNVNVVRVKYEEYRKEEPVRGFILLLLLQCQCCQGSQS